MARAATSGWKIWPIGRGRLCKVVRPHSNCGVLKAESWTMVMCTRLRSCASSQRRLSVKPRSAALAPQ
jgi:hypothetical protein